jgi:hypothetical protein
MVSEKNGENNPAGNLTTIELDMMLDDFKLSLPARVLYHNELAVLYKVRLDALVSAGFDAKDAMEIIKAPGIE